ncbi:MAG: M48 family metallopeptidase [Candidatus Omnitrophota bacterium]
MITDIKINRSRRRRRTASARLIDNVMHVYVPENISAGRLEEVIDSFKKKIFRNILKDKLNKGKSLDEIAKAINNKYFGGKIYISSIEYVTNQNYKYGCCDFTAKKIRISHRIAQMPDWVRDYVIVHEMAHLIEPNHSKAFWEIVSRYKLAERARGYLIAKGVEPDGQPDTDNLFPHFEKGGEGGDFIIGKERLNEANS